jgi:biopolymer transport protein ExbD
MAASFQSGDEEITGINVTPLVDVMLVLLIIFMVTATYIVKASMDLELPRAATGGEATGKTFAIVITKDGNLHLDGQDVTEEVMLQRIEAAKSKDDDVRAMISADKEVLHGTVVHIMDIIQRAPPEGPGITKFAIEIEKQAS